MDRDSTYYRNIIRERASNLEITVARAYIFLLPLRMISPLMGLSNALHGVAIYFDFILHVIGMMLWVISGHGKIIINPPSQRLIRFFSRLVIWYIMSSLVMACIIQVTKGNYAGESAFSGIIGQCIYFMQYLLILTYNYRVLSIISVDEVKNILRAMINAMMVLGIVQIVVYSFGGFLTNIVSAIDVFKVLMPASNMDKLSLTFLEGASAGTFISIVPLSFYYSSIITGDSKPYDMIKLVIWYIIILYTRSSTGMILSLISTIVFGFLYTKEKKNANRLFVFLLSACLTFVSFYFMWYFGFIKSELLEGGWYLLTQKIFDPDNSSRAQRVIPLYVDFGVFLKYPILGIGNGLQGYYFSDFFPKWILDVRGADAYKVYLEGISTLSNGGVFLPSIISGYGIIGTCIFVSFIKKLVRTARDYKYELNIFYFMFIISIITMIPSTFIGELTGKYYYWFILSIPLMACCFK